MDERFSAEDKELANIMREFETSHYYPAILKVVDNLEFGYLQELSTCSEEDFPRLQSKIQGLREFFTILKIPILKEEQYKAKVEAQRKQYNATF